MSDQKLIEVAKKAAHLAQGAGAHASRVIVSSSREVRAEWRDGKLDRIRESTRQSLSMALFVDGRYSGNTTSDLRPGALGKYVQDWVAATRHLAPDEHRRLPEPASYQGMTTEDLGLRDGAVGSFSPQDRLKVAAQLEEAARANGGNDKIISVSSWSGDTDSQTVCLNSNGFEADERGTHTSAGLSVSVKGEGDRKPRDWVWGSARFLSDLPGAEALGPEALRRSLQQIGGRQVATGRYPIVIENRAVPRFTYHLTQPLLGRAVQQKQSFFEGRIGEQVGSELLTLTDDPHFQRGLGSTAWDSEGMATRPRPVFEKGVLKTFFLDTYYASKLGAQPTTGGSTNTVWGSGKRDGPAMLAGLDKGIFVTSFLGGNSNATTGDYSMGIKGFYVEKGRILHPVSEMNIAGNHLKLWKRLVEVGNDPWPYSSNRAPTLMFDDVQCSGA